MMNQPGYTTNQEHGMRHQYYRPPYQQPANPGHVGPMGARILSPRTGGLCAVFGLLLFFIGIFIVQGTIFTHDGDTVRKMVGSGRMLTSLGSMLLVLPLYAMGMTDDSLDWKVRASLLSTATAVVIATMIVMGFITPLMNL